MRILIVLSLLVSLNVFARETVDSRLKKIENTLLDLEIKSLQSRILFSGEMINELSYFNTKNSADSTKNSDRHFFANTIMLNANSMVTKNLSVYTTLIGSYFYGDTLQDYQAGSYSSITRTQGEEIRILKAYFDYSIIPDKLVFSMGRLPTVFGPPQHHINEKRLGTYPSMAYSVPMDGVALTWNCFRAKEQSLIFRGIFSPVSKIDREEPWIRPDARNSYARTGVDATDDVLYSLMGEYHYQDLLFILQYYHGDFENFRVRSERLIYPGETHSALFDLYLDNTKMVTLDVLAAHLEWNNLANGLLDLYLSYKVSNTKAHANVYGRVIDPEGTAFAAGDVKPLGAYWLNGTETGHSVLIGGKYQFDPKLTFGMEFLYNGLGSFQTNYYNYRLTDFYYTIGKGGHIHLDYALKGDLFRLTLGYSHMLADWEMEPGVDLVHTKSSRRREQVYLLGRIRF